MTSKIEKYKTKLIKQFRSYDWEKKYEFLLKFANEADLMDSKLKNKNTIINGCQSKVWIHSRFENGLIILQADSESKFIKGIAAIIINIFNMSSPKDVLKNDCSDFVDKMGFSEFLSVNRNNGLLLMIQKIKDDAEQYLKNET